MTRTFRRRARALLLALLAAPLLPAGAIAAEDEGAPLEPLWELGLGAAALRLPDYRGADVSHNYLLPLPYIVYRGDWLRADREGARAVLLDTPRWELNLSAYASVPVRSDGNPAREGMRDLPATVELGPQLIHHLWRAEDRSAQLDLLLPVRAVIGLTGSRRSVGTVFTPALNLDLPRIPGGWHLGLQAALDWGDRRHHTHYYGVSAAEARPGRPAYDARSGYAGWHALAAMSQRIDNTWVGMFMRYDRLGGAVFADSPLVRQRHALSAGIGVSWIFARSSRHVRTDD